MVRAADAIMDQVERLILEGKVRPGQKLPSERALAEEFDVSRPTVREAIQKLEARGLVQRRHGGGTFVAEHVGSTFLDPMMAMIQRSPDGTFDIIELRFALENVAAWLAADRATERARGNVQRRYHELQVAVRSHDLHREARADAEFHLAIAEASQNGILGAIKDHYQRELRSHILVLCRHAAEGGAGVFRLQLSSSFSCSLPSFPSSPSSSSSCPAGGGPPLLPAM